MATVCIPPLYLVTGGNYHPCKLLLNDSSQGYWSYKSCFCPCNTLPLLLHKTSSYHHSHLLTTLHYLNDRRVTVWVYDGNIGYFEGKHIPLFLARLLSFLLLFLPYTLLLLFGQCIEAGSKHTLYCPGPTTSKLDPSWMLTMHRTRTDIATGLDCCWCFALSSSLFQLASTSNHPEIPVLTSLF